jgi:non-specific serine/threonine protein kinase
LSARRHNLPIQLTSFVGRDREVVEVVRLIKTTRLLTLAGAAGSGKTRLSLHVAAELVDDYADGVWFVDLAPVAESALVMQTVSLAIDVRDSVDGDLQAKLLQVLAGSRVLLILDNCEHVLAACARLTENLLRSSEHLCVLATSREPLGVPGETIWRVPSLSLPQEPRTRPSFREVASSEAVRLFTERARAALPTFVLSPDSAGSINQICWAVDGIPLGVELAASWVGTISVHQIAARLDKVLRLLSTGGRARPSRHQTIRAAIEWSYGLLSAAEQTFLQRVSVFVGGWSLEAAEEIATGDGIEKADALDLLRSMVMKSLAATDSHPDGSMRYKLLEVLRQFAQERLEDSGMSETVHSRHADYYVTLGEQAEPDLRGGPHLESWLNRLDLEQANLRAAFHWCTERLRIDLGLRLGGAVWGYWHFRGRLDEGREWLNALLRLAEEGMTSRDALRAKVLNGAGVLALGQEDFATAQQLVEESCAVWRDLGDYDRVAACLHNLAGIAWWGSGDYAEAERLYEEALNLARNHGLKVSEALTLCVLGSLFADAGDYRRARPLIMQGVRIWRELGDELDALLSELDLAWVYLQEGDSAAARKLYIHVLTLIRENHPADGTLECLEGLAAVAARDGDVERALRLAAASAHLREGIGRPVNPLQRKRLDSWFHVLQTATAERTSLAARTQGESMSLAEAIEYALADTGSASSPSPLSAAQRMVASGVLTRREQEVAALLSKGCSNQEIADALTIANSTAERHVANILIKLGLHSRLQVGLWAAQHGLT